jgi:hypothetical protein
MAIASAMPLPDEVDLLKRDGIRVYEYKGVDDIDPSEM